MEPVKWNCHSALRLGASRNIQLFNSFAMLYFVVVLSLLSVALADDRPVVHLPPLVLNTVMDAAANCVKETSVSQEVSDNFFKLNFGSDPDSKKFIYCLCRKTNYGNEDGHLNDGFITLFEGTDKKDDIQKVIDDCNKNKDKDNLETMYQTVQCFYKNTPVVLVV